MNLRALVITCAAAMIACHGDSVAPGLPAPPVPPTVVALEIAPWNASITLGREQMFVASKRLSDRSTVPVAATWVSTSPDVVTIDTSGTAVAVGIGQANIFASANGLTAMSSILVKRPVTNRVSSSLIVDEFSMMEMESGSGYWWYAPQLRVHAAGDLVVRILMIDFVIPGLGAAPPWICAANITSKVVSDLNGEVYGEWAFSIEGAVRGGGTEARADITFLDETNKMAKTSVYGPIVPGGPPFTDTSGDPGNACYAAYRPPG